MRAATKSNCLDSVIRRSVALCAVPSVCEHSVGLSRQFRVYFADNPFSIFVLIILFAQAPNQAGFIFYLKKAAQKSASFGTKSTCDITSCGLHKHLHSLSFEIFSYGRNCKYNLFNTMLMYTRNGCKELKRKQLYGNLRFFFKWMKNLKLLLKRGIFMLYDIFVNCNWVVTRWQYYSTHLHIDNTQNNKNNNYTG